MFAPLIAKPLKTAGRSSEKSSLRRATTYNHDRDIEQLQTSRRAPQTGPSRPDNEPLCAASGFSKIPLFPRGQTSGSERTSPASAPRLPIQAKLEVGAVNNPPEQEADRVADQVRRMPASPAVTQTAAPQVSRKRGGQCGITIQRKLTISSPGDAFEREADNVADRVMRMIETGSISGAQAGIQRKCAECEKVEENLTAAASLQSIERGEEESSDLEQVAVERKVESSTPPFPAVASPHTPVDRLARSKSGGELLSPGMRYSMETAFGRDFSGVRVHRDSEAAELSLQLSALAFTDGNHIYFGNGRYDPEGSSGKRLLAHELVHVVQQGQAALRSGAAAPRTTAVQTTPPASQRAATWVPPTVRETSSVANSALAGVPAGVTVPMFRGVIARWPIPPPNRQLGAGPQLPADAQMVDLDKIEFTQPGISFTTREGVTLGRLAAQMRKTGWDISKPADIVKMDDGRLVSLDHRRLWAAARSGVIRQVSARVHAESDRLTAATASRFKIERGKVPSGANPATDAPWKAGDRPSTWGDVVRFRSAVQGFEKVGKQSNLGIDPTGLPGGGVRDPSFPAAGSKDPPMRVQPGPFEEQIDPTAGGHMIKSGGQRKNVPTGKGVTGMIEGGDVGTGPPGGGGGGGPTVETDIPGTTTTAPARARTISGSAPQGGEDFDEGGSVDITAEEQEAISGGPSGQSLTGMLGEWLMKGVKQRQIDEVMKITLQQVDQEISNRLNALEFITMVLQASGDIAYAQVTVRRTTTKDAVVFDLESVAVSGWYRQVSKDESPFVAGGDIQELVETNSFALHLLPSVLAIYTDRLANEIATADAQRRPKLQDCLQRLKTKGPKVPAFSFLGGACLDVLPKGTGP
jgi:hypothetical protein